MQMTLPSSNTLQPLDPSEQKEILSTAWGLNQPKPNVSQEYQAYLQSSLAKFVQSLNEKWPQKNYRQKCSFCGSFSNS